MSDLKKIQRIYEGGQGGESMYFPQRVPNQKNVQRSSTSLSYPLPTTSPDKPAYVEAPASISPVEGEEDQPISKSYVLDLIERELETAIKRKMDYCVITLLKLKKFISPND